MNKKVDYKVSSFLITSYLKSAIYCVNVQKITMFEITNQLFQHDVIRLFQNQSAIKTEIVFQSYIQFKRNLKSLKQMLKAYTSLTFDVT